MILDNLLLNDIQSLRLLYKSERTINEEKNYKGITNRLISLRLAYKISDTYYYEKTQPLSLTTTEHKIVITEYEKNFSEYGLIIS